MRRNNILVTYLNINTGRRKETNEAIGKFA